MASQLTLRRHSEFTPFRPRDHPAVNVLFNGGLGLSKRGLERMDMILTMFL
jgi:hypothetical protein